MKTCTRFRAMLLVLLVDVFFTCASVASTSVKVMTYNVDEGTDFAPIIAVLTNGGDFPTAVGDTITQVQSSNPQLRAELIANEIFHANPDLVGLQEAAIWTFPPHRGVPHRPNQASGHDLEGSFAGGTALHGGSHRT